MSELLQVRGISKVNFLKIDIEGCEFDLLLQNNAWLAYIDKIVLEVHAAYGSIPEIRRALVRAGFCVTAKTTTLDECEPGDRLANYLYAVRR